MTNSKKNHTEDFLLNCFYLSFSCFLTCNIWSTEGFLWWRSKTIQRHELLELKLFDWKGTKQKKNGRVGGFCQLKMTVQRWGSNHLLLLDLEPQEKIEQNLRRTCFICSVRTCAPDQWMNCVVMKDHLVFFFLIVFIGGVSSGGEAWLFSSCQLRKSLGFCHALFLPPTKSETNPVTPL